MAVRMKVYEASGHIFDYTCPMKFMLGVDEAGRGPLAGPVAVGVVAVPERFLITREFPGLVDSKQMSPLVREKTFRLLRKRMQAGDIQFCVRCTSAERIDTWGLTRAVASATARAIRFLAPPPDDTSIYLHGLLVLPSWIPQLCRRLLIPLVYLGERIGCVARK